MSRVQIEQALSLRHEDHSRAVSHSLNRDIAQFSLLFSTG